MNFRAAPLLVGDRLGIVDGRCRQAFLQQRGNLRPVLLPLLRKPAAVEVGRANRHQAAMHAVGIVEAGGQVRASDLRAALFQEMHTAQDRLPHVRIGAVMKVRSTSPSLGGPSGAASAAK